MGDDAVLPTPPLEGEVLPVEKRNKVTGRFLPGVSQYRPGKGRKRGAKDKLSQDFLRDLLKWHTKHGMRAIEKVGKDRPVELLKIMASLVPKHDKLDVEHEISLKSIGLQELQQRTHDLLSRLPTGDE